MKSARGGGPAPGIFEETTMSEILVQYNGKGMGTKGGKSFTSGSCRPLPALFANQCDGKVWVNLSAAPEEATAKASTKKTAPESKSADLKDPSIGEPSMVSGVSEAALSEIFAVMSGVLGDPEQCTGAGAPKVDALEQASGYNLTADLRNDLHGLWLEQSQPQE